MIEVTLYHDGCSVCQDIEWTMAAAFATDLHRYEAVDLSQQKDRYGEAKALGIERLPSLVIDGQVLRLEDHSPIDHYQ